MSTFLLYLQSPVARKSIAFALCILFFYVFSDFLTLFFIIFIFSYIFLELGEGLTKIIHAWGIKKRNVPRLLAEKYATTNVIITILYIVFIAIITLIISGIVPQVSTEIGSLVEKAPTYKTSIEQFFLSIETSLGINIGLQQNVVDVLSKVDIGTIGSNILQNLRNIGALATKFFIGIILSYIFILERKNIVKFLRQMQNGNMADIYNEVADIWKKIGSGFGLILRAQGIIAFANMILTIIGLLIVSYIHGGAAFPYIFTLSILVLIFGFIPVLGTFLSGVPILIIAFGYGGLAMVFACIVMIAVVHAFEAYVLNPKIVSSFMHFPVFITFLILIVSEHFFGIVGLLVGVPIVSIIISVFRDIDSYIGKEST